MRGSSALVLSRKSAAPRLGHHVAEGARRRFDNACGGRAERRSQRQRAYDRAQTEGERKNAGGPSTRKSGREHSPSKRSSSCGSSAPTAGPCGQSAIAASFPASLLVIRFASHASDTCRESVGARECEQYGKSGGQRTSQLMAHAQRTPEKTTSTSPGRLSSSAAARQLLGAPPQRSGSW